MDITVSLAQPTENLPAFTVEFTARQLRWSYYFVTDLNANGGKFAIIDADQTSSPVTFWTGIRIEFNQQPIRRSGGCSAGGAISHWQALAVCIRRPGALPAAPRKNLQLRLGNSNLIEHLPNPSIRHCARIDVAGKPQDTFYQVVKYISDSSLTKV